MWNNMKHVHYCTTNAADSVVLSDKSKVLILGGQRRANETGGSWNLPNIWNNWLSISSRLYPRILSFAFLQRRKRVKLREKERTSHLENDDEYSGSSFLSPVSTIYRLLYHRNLNPTWLPLAFSTVCKFSLWSSPCWMGGTCCAALLGRWGNSNLWGCRWSHKAR